MPLYRQIAHRLRIQGRTPEESERPREKEGRGCYHDEPCRWTNHRHPKDLPPTLIELDEAEAAKLLRIGAVVPHTPPKAATKRKEAPDGEAAG